MLYAFSMLFYVLFAWYFEMLIFFICLIFFFNPCTFYLLDILKCSYLLFAWYFAMFISFICLIFCNTYSMIRQIPVADLRESAHLSGREVKTLFSLSVDRRIDPSPQQCLYSCKEAVLYKLVFYCRIAFKSFFAACESDARTACMGA